MILSYRQLLSTKTGLPNKNTFLFVKRVNLSKLLLSTLILNRDSSSHQLKNNYQSNLYNNGQTGHKTRVLNLKQLNNMHLLQDK